MTLELEALERAGLDERFPRVNEIPFSSETKRMTTLHATRGPNYWSTRPVTRMDLVVGAYDDISSADVSGVTESLDRSVESLAWAGNGSIYAAHGTSQTPPGSAVPPASTTAGQLRSSATISSATSLVSPI